MRIVVASPMFSGAVPLALLGCAAPSEPWVDPSADDDWSDAIASPDHHAEWDAAGIASEFASAVGFGLPSPPVVFADYLELLTHGEPGCPGSAFSEGFNELHGCTTSAGYTFRGAAGIERQDTRVYAEDGSWSGAIGMSFVPADFVILRPDGTSLLGAGNTRLYEQRDSTLAEWVLVLTGTFKDAASSSPWLSSGFSADLVIEGSMNVGGTGGTVNGVLSVGAAAVLFMNVAVHSGCPNGALGGVIGVRQPDATWVEIVLSDACSACGEATWNGTEPIGEVCLDFAPILESLVPEEVP